MTLATVPRYDPDAVDRAGDHAVVVGASIAGLCAARVLADAYEAVTVVERDVLSDEPAARRGVPQARHIHVLQEAGRATLLDLFPAFGEDLLTAGGLLIDATRDIDFYLRGGFLASGTRPQLAYAATRPLYEQTVRRQIARLDGVRLRDGCQVTDFRLDGTGTSVTGVSVRPRDEAVEALTADLVVDATGRTSRTPTWLAEHGFTEPPTDEVHVDVAYSTTFVERPPHVRHGLTVVPSPGHPRGGAVVPVEDDRWLITLWGMHGDEPPTDPAAFTSFAESLPVPHVGRYLEEHPRTSSEVAHYPFPSNLRRRYEALDRFPDGLVVLGDAIASFNPIYGQGMSVAALEAVLLHHTIAGGADADVGRRFFDRAAATIDDAWNLAVGGDHQFPETEGPKPTGTDVLNWYLSRLIRRAHDDGRLFDEFFRVQAMERRPTSLLRPGVVWRVFGPGR